MPRKDSRRSEYTPRSAMARDTRQKFRLSEDQMYYGKPSPRDRGRML